MTQQTMDKFGAVASLGCAIHCACMPVLLGLLPALGGSFFASEPMEWMLFILAAGIGSVSVILGFRKHGKRTALLSMLCGLVLLLYGRVLHETPYHTVGVVSLVFGGVAVATSHLMNHHWCRCKHEKEEKEYVHNHV